MDNENGSNSFDEALVCPGCMTELSDFRMPPSHKKPELQCRGAWSIFLGLFSGGFPVHGGVIKLSVLFLICTSGICLAGLPLRCNLINRDCSPCLALTPMSQSLLPLACSPCPLLLSSAGASISFKSKLPCFPSLSGACLLSGLATPLCSLDRAGTSLN